MRLWTSIFEIPGHLWLRRKLGHTLRAVSALCYGSNNGVVYFCVSGTAQHARSEPQPHPPDQWRKHRESPALTSGSPATLLQRSFRLVGEANRRRMAEKVILPLGSHVWPQLNQIIRTQPQQRVGCLPGRCESAGLCRRGGSPSVREGRAVALWPGTRTMLRTPISLRDLCSVCWLQRPPVSGLNSFCRGQAVARVGFLPPPPSTWQAWSF